MHVITVLLTENEGVKGEKGIREGRARKMGRESWCLSQLLTSFLPKREGERERREERMKPT